MGWTVGVAVSALLLAGCGSGAGEQGSPESSASSASTTPSSTSTSAPSTPSACDDLAGPVGVLWPSVPRLVDPDLDALSSQEAWDRSLAQYEADAVALRQIAELEPELRTALQRRAMHVAEVAAAGRAAAPDLDAIDRARTTSRTLIDPVAVGLGPRMPTRGPGSGGELLDFVQRTCTELLGVG